MVRPLCNLKNKYAVSLTSYFSWWDPPSVNVPLALYYSQTVSKVGIDSALRLLRYYLPTVAYGIRSTCRKIMLSLTSISLCCLRQWYQSTSANRSKCNTHPVIIVFTSPTCRADHCTHILVHPKSLLWYILNKEMYFFSSHLFLYQYSIPFISHENTQ